MEIVTFFVDIFNAIIGFLNGILSLIERLFSPVIQLIDRWNNIFGSIPGEQ